MQINDSLLAVLRLLADGEFHSGEELGALLGVTRAAVWKQIQSIENLGVGLSSVRGKGYRVEGGIDLLDAEKIISQLGEESKTKLAGLNVFPELDSSNQYLLQQLNDGAALNSGTFCFAEMQTAGRGRRGRTWNSPFAKNIYFSTVWNFRNGIAGMEGLSLAVGVALIRALQSLGVNKASLKWPNDILVDNAKLGGVLIEIAGDASGDCSAVIGVGLNVRMTENYMQDVEQPWVNLSQVMAGKLDRNDIAAAVMNQLLELMSTFETTGFSAFQKEWEAHSAHLGKQVQLHTPVNTIEGVMLGVGSNGALRLMQDGEEKQFLGGEISVRVSQ